MSCGPITPVLPPPLCLVLAERLKLSSFCSFGQRPPPRMGIAAHQHIPRLPGSRFCSRSFPPLCAHETQARALLERSRSGSWGGNTLPLPGAWLLPAGMLRLILCFLSEIEAKKACDWLRAAGFPQYAQLYEGESCLRIPVPALYLVSYPVSQPNAKGGCKESSQSAGERRGRRGLFTNYMIMC